MAARKPMPPNPEVLAQWKPWMVSPPLPPGGMMPPGGPGKPPSTNISLRLGSGDVKDVDPNAKSAIIMAMLRKLMPAMQTGGGPVPPQPQPFRPGLPGAPVQAMVEGGTAGPIPAPFRPGLPGASIPA